MAALKAQRSIVACFAFTQLFALGASLVADATTSVEQGVFDALNLEPETTVELRSLATKPDALLVWPSDDQDTNDPSDHTSDHHSAGLTALDVSSSLCGPIRSAPDFAPVVAIEPIALEAQAGPRPSHAIPDIELRIASQTPLARPTARGPPA